MDLKSHINEFILQLKTKETEIYNEAGLQFELAFYLRDVLGTSYRIQLERNVATAITGKKLIKSEMDVYLLNPTTKAKHCVELKVPTSGQVPNRMFMTFQDVKFLEELRDNGFKSCFLLFASPERSYWKCASARSSIYKYFNGECAEFRTLYKADVPAFLQQNHASDSIISLNRVYRARWHDLKKQADGQWRYFLLEV